MTMVILKTLMIAVLSFTAIMILLAIIDYARSSRTNNVRGNNRDAVRSYMASLEGTKKSEKLHSPNSSGTAERRERKHESVIDSIRARQPSINEESSEQIKQLEETRNLLKECR